MLPERVHIRLHVKSVSRAFDVRYRGAHGVHEWRQLALLLPRDDWDIEQRADDGMLQDDRLHERECRGGEQRDHEAL